MYNIKHSSIRQRNWGCTAAISQRSIFHTLTKFQISTLFAYQTLYLPHNPLPKSQLRQLRRSCGDCGVTLRLWRNKGRSYHCWRIIVNPQTWNSASRFQPLFNVSPYPYYYFLMEFIHTVDVISTPFLFLPISFKIFLGILQSRLSPDPSSFLQLFPHTCHYLLFFWPSHIYTLAVPTPEKPKGRNPSSDQYSPLIKKKPATSMKTHTAMLMTLRALLKTTDFLTPAATIRVMMTAMTRATRSGDPFAVGRKKDGWKKYIIILGKWF